MKHNGYTHPETLVSTGWVAQHATDPGVRLVEVNVDLYTYVSGHIKGAVFWNWQIDFQDSIRRDIPGPQAFEQLLSRAGISNDTTVILYGDKNNWFAAYAFWLLKYYGHKDVRLMNGGRKKWIAEGRPLTTETAQPKPAVYRVQTTDSAVRATRHQVFQGLGQPDTVFIDTRAPKEFSGEIVAPDDLQQEGAMRGGHLPGALNITWGQAVFEDGTFKPARDLRHIYAAQNVTPNKNIIVYCRIGERSSHSWFVLRYLLGYPQVSNYDGSWAEWGNLIGAPIER